MSLAENPTGEQGAWPWPQQSLAAYHDMHALFAYISAQLFEHKAQGAHDTFMAPKRAAAPPSGAEH